MKPEISIIIPSLHSELGRRTLRVCLGCLVDNTEHSYELLVSSHINEGGTDSLKRLTHAACGQWIAIIPDDVYVAPGWDSAFLSIWESGALLVGSQIESGYIPVHERNIEFDYGRTPETFRRTEFEDRVRDIDPFPAETALDYWGFPWLVERRLFACRVDGWSEQVAGDHFFWRAWLDDGLKAKRAPSWSYHLMAWTGRSFDYLTGKERTAHG